MQSGKQIDLIFLDFSKTFDKVAQWRTNFQIALLRNSGLNTFFWIKDFCDTRSQVVLLNGVNSDRIAVSSAVTQGSVLGPILFLV